MVDAGTVQKRPHTLLPPGHNVEAPYDSEYQARNETENDIVGAKKATQERVEQQGDRDANDLFNSAFEAASSSSRATTHIHQPKAAAPKGATQLLVEEARKTHNIWDKNAVVYNIELVRTPATKYTQPFLTDLREAIDGAMAIDTKLVQFETQYRGETQTEAPTARSRQSKPASTKSRSTLRRRNPQSRC